MQTEEQEQGRPGNEAIYFNTPYLHFFLIQKLNSKHVNCKRNTNRLEIIFSGTHSKERWPFWPIKLSSNFSSSSPLSKVLERHMNNLLYDHLLEDAPISTKQ